MITLTRSFVPYLITDSLGSDIVMKIHGKMREVEHAEDLLTVDFSTDKTDIVLM